MNNIFKHTIRHPNYEGMKFLGFEKIPSSNEYHYKLLDYKLKTQEFESCLKDFLKEFSKTEQKNSFLKFILDKYNFDMIYSKIKTKDFWALSAYFRGVLNFCPICGNPTLSIHCSNKCSNSSEKVKELKKKTLISNYGVTNPMFSETLKEKIKNTNLEKYGVEQVFQANCVKEKIKQTNLERYGFEQASKSKEVKETTRNTNLEKYGVEWFTQTELYLEKNKKTNLEKYGVDNVSKYQNIKEKIKEKLFQAHNHKNFDNFNAKFIKEKFVENKKFKVKEFMEYFDFYDRCSMNKVKKNFGIIEPNNDWDLESGHSKAELELFEWIPLDNKILGDRTLIAPYEIDILLPDLKLAIEYNGAYWHSFYPLSYHLNKLNMCIDKGFELWYIYDYDDINFWKQRLLDKINNVERKFDLQGLIDRRLYNKEELKNPIIQILDPTEEYVLGRFLC